VEDNLSSIPVIVEGSEETINKSTATAVKSTATVKSTTVKSTTAVKIPSAVAIKKTNKKTFTQHYNLHQMIKLGRFDDLWRGG